MPIATLRFNLPDEQSEFTAACHARAALATLWDLDNYLRSLLKHGELADDVREALQLVRDRIPSDLLDI